MKKYKLLIVIGVAVLIGIVTLLAYKARNKSTLCDVIHIGSIAPLTGGGAVFGKYNQEATDIATELLSKEFGLPVRLLVEDSKSTAKDAINAYMHIKNKENNVRIICSEMTSVACAVYPFVSRDSAFLISIAVADDLRGKRDTILVYPGAAQIYACLLSFLENENFRDKVSVFCINDDFGRSIAERFLASESKSRFEVLEFDAHTDIKSLVAKSSGECACVCGYGAQLLAIIRELQTTKRVKYIVSSPEFAFPEYYNAVDSSDERLYYMEFGKYDAVLSIMGERLKRAPNLIDFLIFGEYLTVFSAVQQLSEVGLPITGHNMVEKIQGQTFSFRGYEISFDETCKAKFELVVMKAKTLLSR